MQCSWKAVFLLALASIAIQYTAIRTLTSRPFKLCSAPISQSCGLAGSRDTEAIMERGAGGVCMDSPSLQRSSQRSHILVLATTRTGSSFVGQLLNQHQDVFYLFEPLYHVQTALVPSLSHGHHTAERRIMLGASRDLLQSLYSCNLAFLESYIQPAPINHTTDRLFRRGASRALCSPPVCHAFHLNDANVEEGDCVKRCSTLNISLASQACRQRHHVAIKVVRVPEVGDLRGLVEDPRLNVKVVQLVRDPRGILSSRMETFRDSYRLWRVWRATGRKPYNLDTSQLTVICQDFYSSVSTGLSAPAWLRGRYMLLRYEDLARSPLGKTREMYNFLGLSMDESVERWIRANTRGSRETLAARHKYGTVRDSAANAESWRLKLSYDVVEHTQVVCQRTMQLLGYRAVRTAGELRNLSVSLVQNKRVGPFL